MSTLVARQPLQTLSMSSVQRGPRRLSARLQEKDKLQPPTNGNNINGTNGISSNASTKPRTSELAPTNNRKRKNDYDEEDDGFMFARVKKRKPRASTSKSVPVNDIPTVQKHSSPARPILAPTDEVEGAEPAKKRRNKMSFSTPGRKQEEPIRRSKRLSADEEEFRANPRSVKQTSESQANGIQQKQQKKEPVPQPGKQQKTPAPAAQEATEDEHSSTKISLPFADTPVIRRNKQMREGKGERRSSLGLRGRRASSLIETGNSNALPHQEVAIPDFYKHIESEGLPEPRRMRQLLTWCATRALGEKPPMGTEAEDQSARLAARVIQEELLKDLANRSEMSDWFGREDAPAPSIPLPTRPNPKNAQNESKIKELEEQIKRLRAERDSLESLMQPPAIPPSTGLLPEWDLQKIDKSLLSSSDAALLESVKASASMSKQVQERVNTMRRSVGPMVDLFADGIHKIGQYRDAAENIAGRALAICAEKLAEKEKQGRRQVSNSEGEQRSPGTELGNVLRSLSRIER